MKTTTLDAIRKIEFEARIFISLGIVLVICLLSFLVFPESPPVMATLGRWLGLSDGTSLKAGYALVAGIVAMASLLRMWAGSVLSSPRVMSFEVRKEALTIQGPYLLTRNPIYLADLVCFCSFVLCLPLVGLALPLLLYLHYLQLIAYEEKNLQAQFKEAFVAYTRQTPRFLPNCRSFGALRGELQHFFINWDGFRHNAQYLLLIPGFGVSAFTGNLLHAILIGLPGILDWAIVHTRIGLHPEKKLKKQGLAATSQPLPKDKVFRDILYAQCWEDPQMDRQAFHIGPEEVVFSITSGGCNTLAFLADNPKKVIALDISPYQNYLLELKMAAFSGLSYDELLEFIGVLPSNRRMAYYQRIAGQLRPESRAYWDAQTKKITEGILHAGRYEGYMRLLRRLLVLLVGRDLPRALYHCQTVAQRKQLFEKRWDNLRWKLFTRIFLSRGFMTALFTKAFFEQVEGDFSFGEHFRKKAQKALTELPLQENHFLAYILLGNYYSADYLPDYLKKENYEHIKSRLDRVEIVTGNCGDYFDSLAPDSLSRFNFSNIFEWMPAEEFHRLLQKTIRVARDGSVLTYRNLLVPRSRPESLAAWIQPDTVLAAALYDADRSFIYRAYQAEKIVKHHGIPS
jgi:S-adenosylmethionine-diacylglycerol 3-amino-3-carboxypropyl transferase